MDLMQLDRAEPLREGAERAAGLDLRELAVIADQYELCLRMLRCVREGSEIARADHAGLVDEQHRAVRERHSLVEALTEARDRSRVDPRLVA